ncbi:hypothetical protein KUCAC02_019906 [Chaenocephalus aceratus]|uniref:Uncharacterized protein n=1 Tax=Chaenocephalus aceratus TaxID=36190 RepID=A0ACB9VQI6_CHAAC|nr:hypothetical protein KUCAC02_019906 [Chaenocephalus aceratus]
MPPVKYQRGDMVMGRWPGSSLYYEVKVLHFEANSQLYTVIYKDGTELELKEQDIKSAAGFQARPRSRSRSRSPGRRRSRSRSPARTTRPSCTAAAAVAAAAITESAPPSRRDAKLKDSSEVRLIPPVSATYSFSTTGGRAGEQEEICRAADVTSISKCSTPHSDAVLLGCRQDLVEQTKASENNGSTKHGKQEDNEPANKVNEKSEPEKNQSRLQSAAQEKDDGDGKAEAKAERLEEQEAKPGFSSWYSKSTRKTLASPTSPPPWPPLESFWDAQALGFVVLWILFQVLLYMLPSESVSNCVSVRFFAMVVSGVAVAAAVQQGADLTYIHSHFLQLAVSSFLVSVLLSSFLYVRSGRAAAEQLAGRAALDMWLMTFSKDMRPGLIGWCLINFALALAEMKRQGLEAPSHAMILVNLFQLLYVADGLWNEEAILTTMDLMHDGFGFMLAFGDLVWVPFTYTLQAYYLVSRPTPLSPPALAAIVTLKLVGFYIFRKSNSEKNAFRRNPSDPQLSHLKTIPTATGRSLLVSGWWGVVRHPNYLGDLLMALAWSLPCGFSHLLPWYYMIYFLILLVHRDSRDMSECRRKYGSAWDEYCRTVRYRIIPRVY